MYSVIRPLLFSLPAERSHDITMAGLAYASQHEWALKLLQSIWGKQVEAKPIELMGLSMPNPVGVAAGLDKQGLAGDALGALGFGWVEFGTVTPLPQQGNHKPRMFRLTAVDAIINRMGFNSIGLDAFMQNIEKQSASLVKGLNIGKNAATPIENAIDDYLIAFDAVYPVADYITLNISSPNTKNLRSLQEAEAIEVLLAAVTNRRERLADQYGSKKPIVLKVAPDLTEQGMDSISTMLLKYKIEGLAATNTTISRDGVEQLSLSNEAGGLSGAPLTQKATEIVDGFSKRLQGEVAIIGVGGIDSVASAKEKFQAGAQAIQLLTGLIYRGPKLVREIVNSL